jgi:putative ATPase
LVCACEDVGLAYPQIIPTVKAAVDSAYMLGLPEARIPLADAVVLVCLAPKSNSGVCAIDMAVADLKETTGTVLENLRDSHYAGAEKLGHGLNYKYPHSFGGWVDQQYLPDALKDRVYYVPGDNKTEKQFEEFWKKIKGKS